MPGIPVPTGPGPRHPDRPGPGRNGRHRGRTARPGTGLPRPDPLPYPPLAQGQAPTVLSAFHPLWARIPLRDLAGTDDQGARGILRAYAQFTTPIIDMAPTDLLACSGSALLDRAWHRLKGA